MSIGQHRLGRMFTSFRASLASGLTTVQASGTQTLPETRPYQVNGVTAE